jgi:hypothetical protein
MGVTPGRRAGRAHPTAGVAGKAQALGIPTWYSNPISYFTGSGICGLPESINGLVLLRVISAAPPG